MTVQVARIALPQAHSDLCRNSCDSSKSIWTVCFKAGFGNFEMNAVTVLQFASILAHTANSQHWILFHGWAGFHHKPFLFLELSSFRGPFKPASKVVVILGWSKLQEVQKSPLPGHFPILLNILNWKMQKKLKKIVVLPLLKSNLCVLLRLCSNRLTNTLLWPKSPSKCCPISF